MNRYIAAVLTGLYIILVGGVVVTGLIDQLFFSSKLDQSVASALGMTGLVACLVFGIQFGVQRARMDRPWRLTRVHKAVMFVLVYVAIRIAWSYVKSYVGMSVLGGGALPPMETIYRALFFDAVIRLPFSAINYKPLQNLEMDYEFAFFFINGVLWAVAGILIITAAKRLRARLVKLRPI